MNDIHTQTDWHKGYSGNEIFGELFSKNDVTQIVLLGRLRVLLVLKHLQIPVIMPIFKSWPFYFWHSCAVVFESNEKMKKTFIFFNAVAAWNCG